MQRALGVLVLALIGGLAACDAPTVCDTWCERTDECSGTDVAAICKESYAQSLSAEPDATTTTCQEGLDALDVAGACGGDDDDSAG